MVSLKNYKFGVFKQEISKLSVFSNTRELAILIGRLLRENQVLHLVLLNHSLRLRWKLSIPKEQFTNPSIFRQHLRSSEIRRFSANSFAEIFGG